jgi:N-methylhydantoinase A
MIAPFAAGVGSTLGFLVAPIAFDFVRGAAGIVGQLDWSSIDRLYREMEAEGHGVLAAAQVQPDTITFRRTCDMRLAGQAHQISVRVPDGHLSAASAAELQRSFDETYLGLFKRAAPGVPAEALNWRLRISGPAATVPALRATGPGSSASSLKGTRPAYLAERGDFAEVPVYDRYLLAPTTRLTGPAIVEERESTVVLGSRAVAIVDEWSNLVVDLLQEG